MDRPSGTASGRRKASIDLRPAAGHAEGMTDASANRIFGAIERLKQGERDAAAALLRDELRLGAASGDRWRSVQRLAADIGEIEISLEAARRFAATEPVALDRLLGYCSELTAAGRTEQARAEVARLPERAQAHPAVLHFLGTVAGQVGDFALAEDLYRRAIAASPNVPQTWFALAMIKTFSPDDPDLERMIELRPRVRGIENSIEARFLYGLAKAFHDCGDFDRAFALYSEGAALRRAEEKYEAEAHEAFAEALLRDFDRAAAERLIPSQAGDQRVIFVNGLPRSGTTLVEQILASHSHVEDGAEVNLLRAALIPTVDRSYQGAVRYQERAADADPWGKLARDYRAMLTARFETEGLVVDKTLNQSRLMGLLLHTLPDAKVIWLRRNAEDAALSCFRSFFTSQLAWTWSLEDIGHFFRTEDRLYAHWTQNFPERILTVPYEELVRQPAEWIPRIVEYSGLTMEPQVLEFHRTKRSVRTASVQQVRSPISAARVGASEAYAKHMAPFREAYRA
jgi:tetratricopeptide (TPR) repeat protein